PTLMLWVSGYLVSLKRLRLCNLGYRTGTTLRVHPRRQRALTTCLGQTRCVALLRPASLPVAQIGIRLTGRFARCDRTWWARRAAPSFSSARRHCLLPSLTCRHRRSPLLCPSPPPQLDALGPLLLSKGRDVGLACSARYRRFWL